MLIKSQIMTHFHFLHLRLMNMILYIALSQQKTDSEEVEAPPLNALFIFNIYIFMG